MSGLVLLNVFIFTALRLAFLYQFHTPADPLSSDLMMKSLYIGLKFDVRLVLLINLPVFLFARLKFVSIFDNPSGQTIWSVYIAIIHSIILLLYFIDFAFYAYLKERINASAIRFTQNPLISLQMIWETYPVVWSMIGLVIIIFLFTKTLKFIIKSLTNNSFIHLHGWKNIILYAIMVFLWIFGIYGKFSYYPLRWSDAFYSPHQFASSLALNPVIHIFDTIKNRERKYDIDETRKHYDLVASFLGVEKQDKETLNYTRHVKHQSALPQKPNIIFVIIESLAF